MKIKIFLADDQHLMLEGIKAILKHEPEIEIVGTARDGHSALSQVIKLQPDLVLIDIEMPKMNGIIATKFIRQYLPYTRVLVLTSHKKPSYLSDALQAGASGYLLKDTLIQDLKHAIHSLGRGYAYIESKFLADKTERLQTANIARYKNKIAYLKKHRKSVYKPNCQRQTSTYRSYHTSHSTRDHFQTIKLGKETFGATFSHPSAEEILLLYQEKSQNYRSHHLLKFDRRRYLRNIIWMLIAIASFVLSIIFF